MKNWFQNTHIVVHKCPLCFSCAVVEQNVREVGGGMSFG